MAKRELEGKQFGRLKVTQFAFTTKNGKPTFECLCACGKIVYVDQYNLLSGIAQSCGCLRTEKIILSKIVPDAGFRGLFQSYKLGAKRRGIPWELTEEQFRKLTSSPCYYTGREPASVFISSNAHTRRRKHGLPPNSGNTYCYNGIDRIDSSKGYTLDNCVPACKAANLAKQSLSHDEFIALCKEIAARH